MARFAGGGEGAASVEAGVSGALWRGTVAKKAIDAECFEPWWFSFLPSLYH
jgi:hypothetical protein